MNEYIIALRSGAVVRLGPSTLSTDEAVHQLLHIYNQPRSAVVAVIGKRFAH